MNAPPLDPATKADLAALDASDLDFEYQISHLQVPATGAIAHSLGAVSGDILAAWGLGDEDLAYAVRVGVRELIANAANHGPKAPGATLYVSFQLETGALGPDRITVAVQDQGSGGLRLPAAHDLEDSETLRGLTVVGGYGARIESILHPEGHTVAAWYPLTAADRDRVCRCPCWAHQTTARCHGLIEPGAGQPFTDPHGVAITVCPPCAHSITADELFQPAEAARDDLVPRHPALATAGGR